MNAPREKPLFSVIEYGTLAGRLLREFRDGVRDFALAPLSYLRVAFLPDSLKNWLPGRLGKEVASAASAFGGHPITFIKGVLSPDSIELKRRRLLRLTLGGSALVHSVLICYLVYVAVISPFARLTVVDKRYREIDVIKLLAKLHYPPQMLRGPGTQQPLTLEEIRERERKRREQLDRRKREEADKEAERKKAEEAKKAQEAKEAAEKNAASNAAPSQFGEINVAPIKDIVNKIYETYQAGQLDADLDKFSIMARFKIERDGSIPASSIGIIKSSGSKIVDKNAIEILWRLGESHALGPLSTLSSNTIRLDVNETTARLTITSFAPSADEAKKTAGSLNFFLALFRATQKSKNPNVAELLGLLRVTSDNNRVDAQLTVSRARASEMMRAQFSGPTASPPH